MLPRFPDKLLPLGVHTTSSSVLRISNTVPLYLKKKKMIYLFLYNIHIQSIKILNIKYI